MDLYIKNTPKKNRLTNSILAYILAYTDTSIKKSDRIECINKAAQLLEFIVARYSDEDLTFFSIFNKMLEKTKKAEIDRNTLYDFSDEIGFLRILGS